MALGAEVSLGRRLLEVVRLRLTLTRKPKQLLEVRPRLALTRKPRQEDKYKGEQRAHVSG